jgi:LuxR family maltose regulon positive regulatory protein
MLAYLTLARCAAAQAEEHRAHDLLEALHACGVARSLPRLCATATVGQLRLHAARSRCASASALRTRLMADRPDSAEPAPLLDRAIGLQRNLGQAYIAIACGQWATALPFLDMAGAAAASLRLGRPGIEIMALRGLALRETGGRDAGLLDEARDLARTLGLENMLADTHPRLAGTIAPAPARPQTAPRYTVPEMMLTPKEREILGLLAHALTNKEIAAALTVGEETVKWHIKNLFSKLDAASRKHAVHRAQLLGLL